MVAGVEVALVSQSRICFISSVWEIAMRFASSRMLVLSVRSGTQSVITIACWWWWIMPCMKATSASVCGSCSVVVPGGDLRDGSPGAPGWTTLIAGCSAAASCSGSDLESPHPARQADRHARRQ